MVRAASSSTRPASITVALIWISAGWTPAALTVVLCAARSCATAKSSPSTAAPARPASSGATSAPLERNDTQFLDSEANAAMNEMMGIIGSLRIGAPPSSPDGTGDQQDLQRRRGQTPGGEDRLRQGQPRAERNRHRQAGVRRQPPTPYAWTGPVPPAQAKAESIQAQAPAESPAAPLAFGVVVTDGEGKAASAAFSLPVSDLRLSLSKASPAETKIPVGGAGWRRRPHRRRQTGRRAKYRDPLGATPRGSLCQGRRTGVLDNSAVLLKPGRAKLWAVALAEGATLSTAAGRPRSRLRRLARHWRWRQAPLIRCPARKS